MNWDAELAGLDGKALDAGMTLRKVCVDALMFTYRGEEMLDGTTKLTRYMLAQRIHSGDAAVRAEDVVMLKDLIGRAYGPAVVGPAYLMLDPAIA